METYKCSMCGKEGDAYHVSLWSGVGYSEEETLCRVCNGIEGKLPEGGSSLIASFERACDAITIPSKIK